MAVVALCESRDLFNLLSQRVSVSRLAEMNYLCLMDARETQDYHTSHIITARHNQNGAFLPLESVEIDTILSSSGRAHQCAKMVSKSSLCVVHILRGGFEKFSALYPFLRTEKIMYTIKELEDVRSYPVEIIPQKVYMSSEEQSLSRSMMDDLKIKAVVCISARDMYGFKWTAFVIRFLLCFWTLGSRVLIVSLHGFRRCSAAATAYVMHHYKYSVQVIIVHYTEAHSVTLESVSLRRPGHMCRDVNTMLSLTNASLTNSLPGRKGSEEKALILNNFVSCLI
uniref:Rhodanese domain-containing protein n=1 Tax=Neogobius melanostomus TaxID=47308 RepID=A0A8C6UIF0_9GOBI